MEAKHYELTYIIATTIPETEHAEIKKQVESILEKNEAVITDQQDLGKKKFTYAIDKIRHGFYLAVEFDILPDKIEKINEELKLNNQVLRSLLVIKKQLTPEEKAKQIRLKEVKDKAKKEAVTAKVEEKVIKKTTKVSLEDLDEKLDQIFAGKDLIK